MDTPVVSLHVEEIAELTDEDLRSFFSAFGDVTDVQKGLWSDEPCASVQFAPGVDDLLVEAALGQRSSFYELQV